MQLSERLRTVAGAVTPGHALADIGTDHGYVPIYLVKKGVCPRAIAMDVRQGPLDRARANIRQEGLSDLISCRLSDGLEKLSPDEADTIVIAGMGGALTCRILENGAAFLEAGKELVLGPQSEWFKVRHFLQDHRYQISNEWFLKEDGKYYLVIRAVPRRDAEYAGHDTERYYRYGRILIEERHPVFMEYLEKEYDKKKGILERLKQEGKTDLPRCRELEKEAGEIGEILMSR